MPQPRKANTLKSSLRDNILTDNNIDQIYQSNIMIVNTQDNTFGNFPLSKSGTITADLDLADDYNPYGFGVVNHPVDLRNDYEKQ